MAKLSKIPGKKRQKYRKTVKKQSKMSKEREKAVNYIEKPSKMIENR